MITQKQDEQLRPKVQEYITSLAGRYSAHCSDKFLEALIMRSLERFPNKADCSYAQLILNGEHGEAYAATCWIFEGLLEIDCGVLRNGHSAAQKFEEFFRGFRE